MYCKVLPQICSISYWHMIGWVQFGVVSDCSIFGCLTLACFITDWDKCRRGKANIPPFTGWQLIPGRPLRTSRVFWALFLIALLIDWTSWGKSSLKWEGYFWKCLKKVFFLFVFFKQCPNERKWLHYNTSHLSVEVIRRLCGLWRVNHQIHSDLSAHRGTNCQVEVVVDIWKH